MVRLNALGQSSIEVGAARIGPEQPYLFAVALYLIVERGKKIPRRALVDLIWPDVSDEKHARQRFRQALLRLRESGIPIIGDNGTLLLEKHAAETDFDVLSGHDLGRPGRSLEFLPHYSPKISDRFHDWVDAQRARVHADVQRLFLARMQQARSRGDWAEVDALASECLRLDPYNEEAVMAHAECAAMRGSKREALTILDGYMEALGSHVGTIGLPAKILRTRIAERLTDQRYAMISEQHFVGRDRSMEMLLGLLREAQRSSGSAAFIWGEPGIGKSRLVQELTQVASLEGARTVFTKCHPTDAGRPLSAFADLVPILKTLPGALGCSPQTLALLQRLTDRNKGDVYPAQEAGDAALLAATIRRAVFDLVDAVADEGMLVVVVEDVHWLDEPSWGILSAMVEWSTTRSLLFLITSRRHHPTETNVADPERGFHRHHLLPLADAQSGTLLDLLTAGDGETLPDGVREWSITAAEGNPYYLRELVRHWVETHQGFGVPRSLAELIEARLNRLSSLALRVLQLCAAFGKHCSFERLEKATDYPQHTLLDAIEELSSAVMLAPDVPGVVVKHDLLAAAALRRLSGAALKLVHRQVATVLEAEINEKHTAVLMWDCAEHWQQAGDPQHALKTVRLCAKHLMSVGHVLQAIELHEKALAICATNAERLAALLDLALSLKSGAKWSRLHEVITDAEPLANDGSGQSVSRDHLQVLRMETDWRLGTDPLNSAVQQVVAFASDELKVPSLRLQAIQLGMILCSEEGRREDAHLLFSLVPKQEAIVAEHSSLTAHIGMMYHADFGEMTLALEHANALQVFAAASDDPSIGMRAQGNVALCFRRMGLLRDAEAVMKNKLCFASGHGLDGDAGVAAAWLSLFALHVEDFDLADHWYAEAQKFVPALDEKLMPDTLAYVNARIALHRGEFAPAEDYLKRFPANVDKHRNFRVRQASTAIRCELALAKKGSIDEFSLELLARDFEEFCDLGYHDYFALALCRGLRATGQESRASRILKDYVFRRRRDQSPLPPSLKAELST